ncbi:hypothetical protein [Caulobacter sp.]|uniref:hypothetical protein n=1 Tax=Caulobacter sp. TaxID=78 RepID=UPI001B0C1481|nr:hypothetical protein [Caulobacter sp.]MBO9546095.1 hypothetical protein [Caulobacter sp.]
MDKRLVAFSLLLSLVAGTAVADGQHYATAPTQKDAKRQATAEAKATARQLAQCYHPARQVDDCQAVDGGFRCRAETSARYSSCKRAGWVNEYTAETSRVRYVGWRDPIAGPWPLDTYRGPVTPSAYGLYLPRDAGPPPPPAFPN